MKYYLIAAIVLALIAVAGFIVSVWFSDISLSGKIAGSSAFLFLLAIVLSLIGSLFNTTKH